MGRADDQNNGGGDRGQRGYGLEHSGQPILGAPNIPDFHEVRGTASDDENTKEGENPTESESAGCGTT
jgi:hypothetical protein